jgi:hypothetical protein
LSATAEDYMGTIFSKTISNTNPIRGLTPMATVTIPLKEPSAIRIFPSWRKNDERELTEWRKAFN